MKKLYLLVFTLSCFVATSQNVFINEIHYDNTGGDVAEGVEIAGPAGIDLSGYQITAYNGGNSSSYNTVALSGIIPNQENGFGTVWFAISGLQNGAPDGIALDNGTLIQFLSYEGAFMASGGPADGVMSEDIGVSESSSTAVGESLQLTGTGNVYTDFTWSGPIAETNGSINTGQSFVTASCGVFLGVASYTCNSNTVGAGNDGVIINIPYTGSNGTIVSVTTTSGGTVGGDDPALTADGTITITGLFEGAAWDVTLNGGDCDGTTTSGMVESNECDPSPNTCFDLSAGPELFELVEVSTNSQTDVWTETGGTYSMNGFCGGGCTEESNQWLIFGPLDMTAVSDLVLEFDAVESFDGSDLNVQYTSLYTGCPDGSVWTSAQTVSTSGSHSIDLSAATGTDVFIGVQYLDADGSFSSYDLSNVRLASFGTCPTLGTRPTSDCAVCDVNFQSESYVCDTNTTGAGSDTVTVTVPYSGVDNTIVSVTVTGGTQGGDDPALTADGAITISGVIEGGGWSITLNGGDCDGTMVSGTVGATLCDPTPLVINEILADPDGTTGDANNDGAVSSSDDEFVEIYNNTASPIDMSDYTLSDGFGVRHTFPVGTILAADAFIIVFGGGSPVINGLDQTASTGALGLNNGGDTVTLADNLANVITSVTYGSEGGNNQSLGRNPDFTGPLVQHTTIASNPVAYSPGAANDGISLSTSSFELGHLEIYPNPTSTGTVTIKTTENGPITVTIFNILGKQVKNVEVMDNKINVSDLNEGVYFAIISQNNASATKKLFIN